MKKLVLILVVVLLCELMVTEAVHPGRVSGGDAAKQRGNRGPVKCGGKTCKPGQYCDTNLPRPTCGPN
ncbi:hypothetical protein MTO96_001805 [Rhipicephalus appendiculatus]